MRALTRTRRVNEAPFLLQVELSQIESPPPYFAKPVAETDVSSDPDRGTFDLRVHSN